MNDVFDTCEANFLKNIREVQRGLHDQPTSKKLQGLNELLSQAQQELSKMEIQYGICQEMEMKAKINLYKDELRSYRRKVSDKESTVSSEPVHLSDQIFDQEQKGVDPLLQAKRQMYEAQGNSNQAALGLKRNNEKLMQGIQKMGDINEELTVAQKLLGSIDRKIKKNKYTLCATLFVLIIVVIFVIYTYV